MWFDLIFGWSGGWFVSEMPTRCWAWARERRHLIPASLPAAGERWCRYSRETRSCLGRRTTTRVRFPFTVGVFLILFLPPWSSVTSAAPFRIDDAGREFYGVRGTKVNGPVLNQLCQIKSFICVDMCFLHTVIASVIMFFKPLKHTRTHIYLFFRSVMAQNTLYQTDAAHVNVWL